MKNYQAAVVQMNSQPDVSGNLAQASELIHRASDAGATLVALPEHFAYLGNLEQRMEHADKICEEAESFLKDMAANHKIYLVGGSYPVPTSDGRIYNRSLLLNPAGAIVAQYDKIHLFDVDLDEGESYRESDYVASGDPKATVYSSQEMGNIGLSVCYDLRFPELYRKLSSSGADILTVPSAFTKTTGEVHWEVLLRARAIENTCYVVASAQTGTHGANRKTYGHAMIIDPWGNVLADAGTGPGVATAEITNDQLNKVRSAIPSLQHRQM